MLQPRGKRFVVNAFASELVKHDLSVTAIGRQGRADLAVLGEGEQRLLRNRADGPCRREGFDVKRVRCGRVLRSRAGPEQALRTGAGSGQALPPFGGEQIAVGLVGAHSDRNAEAVVQLRLNVFLHGRIPAADEQGSDGLDLWIEPGFDASLDTAQIRFSRRNTVLARKEQGDVDRHAVNDRLLNGRDAFRCAWNLNEEVRTRGTRVQPRGGLDGSGRVVRKQRRDFQRHPALAAPAGVMDRPEQVSGLRQVLHCEFEEDVLVRQTCCCQLLDRFVVKPPTADRLLKDRWVRRQPGHRQIGDVARQGPAVEQLTRDVVEPQALTQIVQLSGVGVHHFSGYAKSARMSASSRSPMRSIERSAAGWAELAAGSSA